MVFRLYLIPTIRTQPYGFNPFKCLGVLLQEVFVELLNLRYVVLYTWT